jgi:hypothetical protein
MQIEILSSTSFFQEPKRQRSKNDGCKRAGPNRDLKARNDDSNPEDDSTQLGQGYDEEKN